jgi:hypothetical protein
MSDRESSLNCDLSVSEDGNRIYATREVIEAIPRISQHAVEYKYYRYCSTDGLYHHLPPSSQPGMICPYQAVDTEQLQRDAEDCLLTYGTAFYPEAITSTSCIYFETASGHRMMDARSQFFVFCVNITNFSDSSQAGRCRL